MAKTLLKAKSRRASGPFIAIPMCLIEHPNFRNLSGTGTRLFLHLCAQLRFKKDGAANNGDLCATKSVMEKHGWSSGESLTHATQELQHYEFILLTRQGNRKKCSLFAVTFLAIDDCDGKLDAGIRPSNTPPNTWKTIKLKWERPRRARS